MSKTEKLLEEILSSINGKHEVSDIHMGVFWTAVTSIRCGLASTLATSGLPPEENQVEYAWQLLPIEVKELARLSLSPRILEASIGIAAINSALPLDPSRFVDMNAEAVIQSRGSGKRIAVVGHFPFVKRLRQEAKELWIFELLGRGRLGDMIDNEIESLLPTADVAAITSTILINHTMDRILNLISQDTFKIMVGPSTPLSPLLFDYGFDALCGSIVEDREQALMCITQGANFRQVRGVRKVTMRR
jgi:uncharacterized protein (DUF4213/DUF364 family)